MRDWLFVEDHAEALVRVVEHGRPRRDLCHRRPAAAHQSAGGHGDLRPSGQTGPRSSRPAGAADPFRHRPARPRFPLRDRPVPQRGGTGLESAARLRDAAWPAQSTGIWTIAPGGRRLRAARYAGQRLGASGSAGPGHGARTKGKRHEGHPARRRFRHAAASDDPRGVETASAGVRQADGLLPAVHADAGGDQGHHADLHP